MNHTVKGFNIVNEAEVDVFPEIPCFSVIQRMLAIWSLVPLHFLNPACTSGSSWFTYCWSLAWRILSNTLLTCEMSTIVQYCKQSLAFPSLGLRTSLVAQTVKCLSTMWETWVRSLGWEDSLEKEMATHSVLLPWKSHGRRSLVQATVHGVAKSRARLSSFTFTFNY